MTTHGSHRTQTIRTRTDAVLEVRVTLDCGEQDQNQQHPDRSLVGPLMLHQILATLCLPSQHAPVMVSGPMGGASVSFQVFLPVFQEEQEVFWFCLQAPAMFPFRQPSDSDLRPDPRRYGSGAERDFFRPPQESLSPGPAPQDGVLSLLSSCGLEPEDLSVLAKLPEDILTVESLPQILKQIKGQKAPPPAFPPRPEEPFHLGTAKPLPARPPSPPPPSSSFKAFSSAPRDWERLRRQPVQYPLHLLSAESRPDRWPGQQAAGSGRSPPPPSSSSTRRAVDQDLRPRPPVYGKDGSSFSGSAGRTRPSRFSGSGDFRTAPPLDERRRDSRPSFSSRVPDRVPNLNRARDPASGAMPSKKQALDFHGTSPPAFPYSCSLCDIAVLSEKVWIQHVNTTGHADGQLNLLQRFPRWDCRLESAGRDENQSNHRRDGANPAPPPPRPNQNRDLQTSKKQQKASDKGKVVCAKFPPQAVDEASLRKLIEPFGKVGKILMFPSLAFVEMGSSDQAKDLVKFYSSSDPEARKVKVEFNISNAFSFLQSSQVVSFTPAPSGEDGRSDLLSIAKRFGEPLYTLFLPSKAFVEMKLSAEAQKLVDYYSASALRINGATIQVAFSSEYRTLLRVPSAQKYEDEPAETKEPNRTRRARSRSGSRDRSRGGRRRRSGSGDRKRPETRTRSRSRERYGTSSPGQNQNQTEGKPKEPQNPESRSAEPQRDEGDDDDDKAQPAAGEEEDQLADEDQSDSDIEGMEVIAEDGQNLDEEEEEEEEEEEQKPEPPGAGRTWTAAGKVLWREKLRSGNDFPDGGELEKTGAEEEEEVEFPVDLESCITLDEVKTDDEDEAPPADCRCEDVGKTGSGEPGPEPTGPTPDHESSGSVSRTQEDPEPSDQTRSTETLEPEPDRTGPEPESQTGSQKVLETRRAKTRSRKSSGDDGSRTGSDEEPDQRKTASRTAPEPGPEKRKATPENDDVPLKTLKRENGPEPGQNLSTAEPEADEEKKQQIKTDEQNPAEPEPREQESGAPPAEGAAEPQKPVGAEFVRPVVGYFCNLCQLIFIDEDEAKLQHCATPAHYRKYQEKTGKDPWMS
ncbi:matrin-3-like isoform X2 [Xiphophorus couchianus]|uniref:matrin-3-like isoform X2 n=1 Tax=Xiphophorus couchianus TaxID=32473 RepID=UPI001016FAF8|nr:matrin-3-like isoform X2 [Xiphophorus couchianus]